MDKLQTKLRNIEKKYNGQQSEHDKIKQKLERENQSLKERLDTVTNMNHNLQRKLNISKRKADQHDSVLNRCIQLENTNQELLRIVAHSGNREAINNFVNENVSHLTDFYGEDQTQGGGPNAKEAPLSAPNYDQTSLYKGH